MRLHSKLTDKEIVDRMNLGDRWMKRFRANDFIASYRYIDANAPNTGSDDDIDELTSDWYDPEGDTPDWVPVGQVNYQTINNETRLSAVAMGLPILHVKANEDPQKGGVPNAGDVVSKTWEEAWLTGNWERETQAGLQKLGICGVGCLWHRWDPIYGPCFEHVPSKRLIIDPHATNLMRLDWGGVKVRMSLRKAQGLYDPNGENEHFTSNAEEEGVNLDTRRVTIRIYFDSKEEVHLYEDKVVHRTPNLYRKVPLNFIEGFIDPRDKVMPLGDNIMASGLNQQIVDLTALPSNMARHGGQITLANSNSFDDTTKEALKSGQQQQILFTKGPLNPAALPVHRVSAEQLSPAYAEARREAQAALDGIMGVTPGQRGEQLPNVTATQSVMVEQRSGARPTQMRVKYDNWITRMAKDFVFMMSSFGGETEEDPGTTQTQLIWRSFQAVYEVKVVEGSASYQNPAEDKQTAMQLYTTMLQSYELYLNLAQLGLMQTVPNMQQYANDMLRAFARQNIEQYWLPAPPPQQQSGPPPDMIKALSALYAKSPPDVRRQIEKDFGLQPSQLGDTPEEASGPDPRHETDMQMRDHEHERLMKSMDHSHDLRMEYLKERHAREVKAADMGHQARMAAVQARAKERQSKSGG